LEAVVVSVERELRGGRLGCVRRGADWWRCVVEVEVEAEVLMLMLVEGLLIMVLVEVPVLMMLRVAE